jgi:hypothetical protein
MLKGASTAQVSLRKLLYKDSLPSTSILTKSPAGLSFWMNTLEPGEISTPSSHRSTDVWFDDRTVVLRAGATLFRVYRGILVAQSPIFRHTFAIPQPATQEMYEGCPVVELHDLPDELGIFLVATHDPA